MGRMGKRTAGVVAVLVLGVLEGVVGQSCKAYENTLSDGSLAFCAGVVDYEYFDTGVQSQEDLDNSAFASLSAADPLATQLLPLLPTSCVSQLKKIACQSTFPKCVVVPQVVVSGSSLTYSRPVSQTCTAPEVYDAELDICGLPLPQFPCREKCDKVGSSNPALSECPLVSGLFNAVVGALAAGSTNAVFQGEANALLAECNSPTCVYTANLLQMFQLAPSCTDTAPSTDFELFPLPNAQSSTSVAGISIAVGSNTDCGPTGETETVPCSAFLAATSCNADEPATVVEPSVALASRGDTCAAVLRDSANQDLTLLGLLAGQEASLQAPADQAACLASGVLDTKRSAYFVPPAPGATPLGSRIDSDGVERSTDTKNLDACPVQVPLPEFANLESAVPLCESVRPGVVGYNSRDCNLIQVEDAFVQFPTATTARCRAAFTELVCSTAQMKPEIKELCLVPGGCESLNETEAFLTNTLPFKFALPRFPSKATCQTFNAECADYIAAAPQLAQDCDALVDITTCGSTADFWGCASSFNGIPQFPDSVQVFLDTSAPSPINTYQTASGINLQPAFVSSVTEPTVSAVLSDPDPSEADLAALIGGFCVCPEPLVAPENPFSPTLSNLTCCALPCLGSMLTPERMQNYGYVQLPLAIISLMLTSYMVLTWGIFKEKRVQYMTFWMSFCSFFVALSFFILAANEDISLETSLCVDNATPQTQDQGFNRTVLTAGMLIFFAQALCAWWCVQAVDLFRKVVMGSRDSTEKSKKFYHLFAWLPATGALAYTTSQTGLGFKAPTPWGLVTLDSQREWLVFYAFIAFCFFVGSACMIGVVMVIFRHVRKTAKFTTQSSGASGKYRIYRTPLLFVGIFVLVWMDIFSFRIAQSAQESTFREAGEAWAGCLLFNSLSLGITDPATNPAADITLIQEFADDDQVGCGEIQPNAVNFRTLTATFVIVNIQGILVFIVFGFSSENKHLWRKKFGMSRGSSFHISKSGKKSGTPRTPRGDSFTSYKPSSFNLSTAEPASPRVGDSSASPPGSPSAFSYSFMDDAQAKPPGGAPPPPPSGGPPHPSL